MTIFWQTTINQLYIRNENWVKCCFIFTKSSHKLDLTICHVLFTVKPISVSAGKLWRKVSMVSLTRYRADHFVKSLKNRAVSLITGNLDVLTRDVLVVTYGNSDWLQAENSKFTLQSTGRNEIAKWRQKSKKSQQLRILHVCPVTQPTSNPSQQGLTLYTIISVYIFSILFSMYFPKCWQGEFVQ